MTGPAVYVNRAILLLAGAAFLNVMVAPDDDRFYWTPLVLGLSFLAAAGAGVMAGMEPARHGFAVDHTTLPIGGALLALSTVADVFADARAYAALPGALAVAQFVMAARGKENP